MKKRTLNSKILLFLLLLNWWSVSAYAQQTTADDKAFKILDKAIGDVFTSEDMGIYFEAIAYEVEKPESIFTLPVYRVFRGGYMFVDKEKFRIELGLMKSICDGKLVVVVEEESKTMIIDSVRKDSEEGQEEEMNAFLNDEFLNGTLSYIGTEKINNRACHKIKSTVKDDKENTHVLYWVDQTTGQLYLMAEFQHNAYNVYWINKIGKAPEDKGRYNVYLPEKGLTTYHGYRVVDNRYTDDK